MKNGLRLIVIVLKTAVAAYLIGCVGLSWLQQLRKKLERFGRMQPKEHRNDQTESETRRPIRVIRRCGGAPAGAFFRTGGTVSLNRLPVVRRTEAKIRSAPRSPTRLRSFKWAKAQSLCKMKCAVTARQSLGAISTTSTQRLDAA